MNSAPLKFWAMRTKKKVGPCETREAALSLFRSTYPLTPNQLRKRKRNPSVGRILTGYGESGPHFDMRWDHHDEEHVNGP